MANIDLGLTVSAFNNATSSLRGVSSDVKQLGENSQETANRLKAIQVVIAGILIDKTLEWGKALVESMASVQGLDLRLQAFAGSASAAEKVMSDLTGTLGGSGFKIDTITAAWIKLRSAVSNNGQATTVITAITNDVAAMGGKDENITNLAESFQRLFAVGTASAREYKSVLQQTGLSLGDLAKAAGESSSQMQSNLKNGFVSAQTFVDAFVAASQARFGFFAQNLKGSIGGAFSLVTNTISAGISKIGATTDVNARVSAFFQNLAAAITTVMNSIQQPQIDAFFDWLAKMQPLIVKTVIGLFNIGSAVLDIATVVGTFLGSLPPDALEFGLIGFALFGKKGALVLGLLGSVKGAIGDTFSWLNTHDMFGNAKAAPTGGGNIGANGIGRVSLLPAQKPGNNPFMNLIPTPEQIAATKKQLSDMMASLKNAGNVTPVTGNNPQVQAALDAAKAYAAGINATIQTTKDKIAELGFKNTGNPLGAEIAQFTVQGDAFNKQLTDAQTKFDTLKIKTSDAKNALQGMKDVQVAFNAQLDIAKQRATDLYNIDTKLLASNTQLLQIQNDYAAAQLKISSQSGGLFNALLGTTGGQAILAFYQQQEQYQAQVQQYSTSILDLQKQIKDVEADPARVALLQTQIDSYTKLQAATQTALNGLTVVGQMEQKLWQQLGQTLTNDVADGISGLIQGTQSLGDVARKVFSDMIDMAVKYLVQLVEIKAISQFSGLGSILPFANGGVPSLGGQVTAFANGGLTQGPTLFGLAGEKGTEAIMPLTRIGGKLGVATTGGGGGDHYHIHLQAVDTQSGMDFIGKHIETIDQRLQQKKRLNRQAK